MPKGVIDFSYTSGKQYVKKRKRLPGANPDKKAEIKQFNPLDGQGTFDGIAFVGLTPFNQAVSTDKLPWRLHSIVWPSQGTTANTRIGNSFFLKSIRFKGYVEISRNVFRPIRWRLKLFRFEKPIPDPLTNANYTGATNAYLKLYKNFEEFSQGFNASQVIAASRHNFYKMIKNMPKDRPYTSKVIASGVIPINNRLVSVGNFEFGQSNSFYQGTEVDVQTEVGCFPIDVLVKCNDRITYSLDDSQSVYEADIRYFLVLEDDFGMGIQVISATYTPGQTPTTIIPNVEYKSASFPCYSIRLSGRAYFTDD